MPSKLILGLLLGAFSVASHAEFVVLDPASEPAPQVQSQRPAVVQGQQNFQGVPNQSALRSTLPISDAIKIPYLKDTLRKLVPQGWNAYVDRNVNVTTPVEMVPAADWKESLRALANRYNLVFKVDNEAKKIFVDQGPGGMRDLQADTRNVSTGTQFGPERQVPVQMPDGRLRFEVRDGQKLSEALRQFLGAGNWNLVWEAGSDIVMDRGFVTSGTDIKAVMDDVLPNFRLHSIIHKGNNTVVVVSNSTYTE